MSIQLRCRAYRHLDQEALKTFECSEQHPPHDYEAEISDWIRDKHEGCVSDAMAAEEVDSVYLYELISNDNTSIIGFGALATEHWPIQWKSNEQAILPIQVIAMVGLCREYHGKPEEAKREDRYSTKILRDLIAKAARRPDCFPAIGLYVHPKNAKAINLYLRNNFIMTTLHSWFNDKLNATYQCMILPLV